jgi:hypothetical protein
MPGLMIFADKKSKKLISNQEYIVFTAARGSRGRKCVKRDRWYYNVAKSEAL